MLGGSLFFGRTSRVGSLLVTFLEDFLGKVLDFLLKIPEPPGKFYFFYFLKNGAGAFPGIRV